MRFVWALALAFLLAGSAAAGEAKRDFVLIRAELLRYLDGDDGFVPYAHDCEPETACVTIGGYVKMRLKATYVLAGKLRLGYFTTYVPMAAAMTLDHGNGDVFILAEMHSAADMQVLTWGHVHEGLCMLDEENKADLERQSASASFVTEMHAAARRYPCIND